MLFVDIPIKLVYFPYFDLNFPLLFQSKNVISKIFKQIKLFCFEVATAYESREKINLFALAIVGKTAWEGAVFCTNIRTLPKICKKVKMK